MNSSAPQTASGLYSADSASEELFERLAELEAVRRSDLEVTRQASRTGAWYIVHDPITFRHHRLSPADYQMFAVLRPGRTLDECFRRLVREGVLRENESDRFYSWIVQLSRLGLITLPIDTGRVLYRRAQEKKAAGRRARLAGILFHRMPLWSPDAFLKRTLRYVSPLFSRTAVALWCVAMAVSVMFVWQHRAELADPFAGTSVAQSAILMAVLLTVLKGVHELGHGYACRYYGGRVPEMGLFFIVFTPCAYVDASAAWMFASRRHRIAVSMAGMYFESIAAMGALVLWSVSDPGIVRAAAHQALLLATVVTIGFNINPLMKFDGYYALADLLKMPELRNDAISEWKRVVKQILYGVRLPSCAATRRQTILLAAFGCAVSLYKLTVIAGISILVAGLPVIGFPLGVIFFTSFCWQLLGRFVGYTLTSEELAYRRLRGLFVGAAGLGIGIGVLFYMPAPGMTAAYGIVGHEFRQSLFAEGDGFLSEVTAARGTAVAAGQPLCRLSSDRIDAQVQQLQADAAAAELAARTAIGSTPVDYAAAVEESIQVRSLYEQTRRIQESLLVAAPVSGHVTPADVLRMPGTFVRQGELLAVVGHGRRVIDAVISEEEAIAGLPRPGEQVQVRLEGGDGRVLRGILVDISPDARTSVPNPALTSLADGPVVVHPETEESEQAWFSLRVVLIDEPDPSVCDGIRAVVRLPVERPSLGFAFYRTCCRLRDSFFVAR